MTNVIFNKKELDKLKQNYSKLESDDEFEIMFGGYNKSNHISMKKFLDIMKFLKSYSETNKMKLEYSNTLDISYNYDKINFHTYRISINGIDRINTLMSSLNNRNNHIIFSILASKIINDNDDSLSIINKIKDFDNTYNIDDYDMRVRLAKEKKVTKKELNDLTSLEKVEKLGIILRYKNRLSVIIESNSDIEIRIDLTSVKQGNNINTINTYPFKYELEIDFNKKKNLSSANEKKYLDLLLSSIYTIKKVVEQSNYIIPISEKQEVISKYKKLLYSNENMSSRSLYGMTSQSLEVVHIVDNLPNRFSVTDKADGQRALGIIYNNKLYFIFSNLDVKYSGYEISSSNKKYNDSIIDGEYIFMPKHNKFLFASFDLLYYGSEDIRSESVLQNRLNKLNDVLKVCFDYTFEEKNYTENFNLEKKNDFYKERAIEHVKYVNNSITKSKNEHVISKKFFTFISGGSDSEVFKYASTLWNLYTKDSNINMSYTLDGIIFTPQDQKYTTILRDTKYRIYKWKPPNQNTIDFFVKFEKNKDTGKILNVYDDSNQENISGKVYKILNLYNGKAINNIEIPVLFKKEDNLHIANLLDDNGVIRDEEGDIIQDNTVVEFSYNDNIDIPFNFRWVPLRTRHDKTESVIKYKKKYGNNSDVANKIWSSIQQNVTMQDLELLGNINNYESQMNELKKRIDASTVAIEKQQDIYYQKITNLAKPMRNFHNYIKSNIIFSYCSPKKNNGKQQKLSILDIGCGRGGDIQKFFHSRIKNYVGFDPDSNGIHSSTDGAISRYSNFRKKMPNMPKMDFMIGDGGALLDYESQLKSNGKMSAMNSNLIKKYFGTNSEDKNHHTFDILNIQLVIHFLLKNDTIWNNFCTNINKFMAHDGYLLISCLDGDMIHESFNKNNDKITLNYTENGESKKFIDFTRNYDKNIKDINRTGLTYNAFVTLLKDDDDKFDIEYIVSKKFLIEELKKKCNLDLVETSLFHDNYLQQETFFKKIAPLEEHVKTKAYFMNVAEYYNQDDSVNKASLEYTKYHRYFIFRKQHNATGSVSKSARTEKKTAEKKSNAPFKKTVKKSSINKKSNKKSLIDRYLSNRTNVLDI
jgi:hypothetical protein